MASDKPPFLSYLTRTCNLNIIIIYLSSKVVAKGHKINSLKWYIDTNNKPTVWRCVCFWALIFIHPVWNNSLTVSMTWERCLALLFWSCAGLNISLLWWEDLVYSMCYLCLPRSLQELRALTSLVFVPLICLSFSPLPQNNKKGLVAYQVRCPKCCHLLFFSCSPAAVFTWEAHCFVT